MFVIIMNKEGHKKRSRENGEILREKKEEKK